MIAKRLLLIGLIWEGLATAQTKKSIFIESFDYSAVLTSVQAIFGTELNIGQGIHAMMSGRIQQGGRFIVLERRKVGELTKEQDFAASNRVKRGTGARVGQIKGADLTLMGDIVVFGRDDRRKAGGVGAIVPGAGGVIGGYKNDNKAVVVLDYRIVDVETSEVIASGEARGESKRSSKGFGAAMFAGWTGGGGAVNMSSSNFAETIIGEATMDAVNQLAEQIKTVSLTGGATDKSLDLDARVADVNGNSVTINAGASEGLQPGQTFTIYHKGREIKDPRTGEVLDVQTTAIGRLVLTSVRDRVATGSYSGSNPPVVGDVVRK